MNLQQESIAFRKGWSAYWSGEPNPYADNDDCMQWLQGWEVAQREERSWQSQSPKSNLS